jgi:peptide deformylase
MAKLEIIVAPDPRLKAKAKPVTSFDAKLAQLLDDMLETMYAAPGIGLAAPQIGKAICALVVDCARDGEPKAPLKIVNPQIIRASEEKIPYEEGCLSLPQHYADVTRPKDVRVRYQDAKGATHELDASGLLAVCIQHEMDHLQGVLFVDHISTLKRSMILRKLQKMKRQKAEDAYA